MDTTKLTAKEYLSQAYRIDQRINSKLEQVQSLRDLATKATATLSNTPRSASRNHHSMEDFITKAMDLESEINADLCGLIDTKREITTVVNCIENRDLQILLEMRYLCYKTWEDIASALSFDLRWLHRLHGRALDEVEATRHQKPL